MHKNLKGGRGQIAIENLTVYAIIIITILVGLVALWQMGVFKPPIGKKGYIGFSQIIPTDWVVSDTNEVYLRLSNDAEGDARIHQYGINITMGRVRCRLAPDAELLIPAGESRTLKANCDVPPTISEDYQMGSYFEADIAIDYTNLLTNRDHESTGRIYGLVEGYGSGPTITGSTTSTTGTTSTTCPHPYCIQPGHIDIDECTYPRCSYCRKWPQECTYQGQCGSACSNDTQCIDPIAPTQNPCPMCNMTTRLCEEPGNDCGKPCTPGENQCQYECDHCFTRWDKIYCDKLGHTCGNPCKPSTFDTYEDCLEDCSWCNTTTSRCDNGDCGQYCTDDSKCDRGCRWCNLTTMSCEPGSCGKECTPDNAFDTCTLGCDKCQNGRCVSIPIAVTIRAANDSGSKEVKVNETIFLNVSAKADRGVHQMIPSKGVKPTDPYCNSVADCCRPLVDEIMAKYPEGITDPWNEAPEIPWFDRSEAWDCNLGQECSHGWTTNETEESVFCYYAIAQENPVFGGKWSPIAYDDLSIGFIKVILAFPRPI